MSDDIKKNNGAMNGGFTDSIISVTPASKKNGLVIPADASLRKGELTENEYEDDDDCTKVLTRGEKLCYGVGHVFNDLCASMWFSYLLIFFEKVLLFDPTLAGVVLLVGQLADGLSTPIVGILSDRENKIPSCAKYGRRKVWHLIGTACVAVSFPFIFSPAYGLETASDTIKSIYYALFVIVFQFGWASVQISHLALIPDLTPKKSQRTELNSIRYAFTVLANLSVFTIAFFVLESGDATGTTTAMPYNDTSTSSFFSSTSGATDTGNSDVCSNTESALCPEDLNKFRLIALICVFTGLFFSLVFHIGVREPPYRCPKRQGRTEVRMRKLDWFRQVPFYLVAVMYMATRLYVNLYQVYIPLLVQDTLCLAKTAVATVPFTMYLAGFFASLVMKKLNNVIGRKGTFAIGCLLGLTGCIWTFADAYSYHLAFVTWGIFAVAVFLGSGGSTLLITSLSITADLIGSNTEGGAFVYGIMSLVDKFSNGIIIMLIQDNNTGLSSYYRNVIFYACGGACVLGLIITAALIPVKVGKRKGIAASVCSLVDAPSEEDEVYCSSRSSSLSSSSKEEAGGGGKGGGVCSQVNPSANALDTISANVAAAAQVGAKKTKEKQDV